jgi:hypothetical protein
VAGAAGAAAPGAEGLSGFSFTLDQNTPATPAGGAATTEPESFDFDELAAAPATTPAAATPIADTPAADDDFDIDSLFGDTPTATPAVTAAATDPLAGIGAVEGGAGLSESAPAAPITDLGDFGGPDFGGFNDPLQGFGAGLTDTGLSGIDEQALYGVLHPLLDGLVAEVRRSLEYHATRYPDAAVQHITLIGGGARLKNIDAYFAQSLGIPTTVGNPLAGLTVQAPKLPPNYANDMGPLFVVALGLALRDLVR